MIVVDTQNNVIGSAPIIERVNIGNEINLIKVNKFPEEEFGFFYIGTDDRDSYVIYEDTFQPDENKFYKFYVLEDGTYQYVEIED